MTLPTLNSKIKAAILSLYDNVPPDQVIAEVQNLAKDYGDIRAKDERVRMHHEEEYERNLL